MTDKVKSKDRKINMIVLLTASEIKFLDRKINKKVEALRSRSAILRLLIHQAMIQPKMLDIKN